MKIQLLAYSLILILLQSCASIHLKVTEQAEINLPDNINNIVVVNKLHYLDNRTDNIIRGFSDIISKYPHYKLTIASNPKGFTENDYRLDSTTIENICKENNDDALIVLEQFHCEINENINNFGKCRNESNFDYEWRIYDCKNKTIIDRVFRGDRLVWERRAPWNKQGGGYVCNGNNSDDYIRQTTHYVGTQYAKRISPHWLDVKRFFYKHGDSLHLAYKKSIKKNDWKSAEEIWSSKTKSANKKIAGKACFNLAVASERDGKLNEALIWANQAKQSGNKRAEKYIAILTKRINHK